MNKEDNRIVPQLRFPEFEEEWEDDILGKRGKFTGGGTPSKSNETFWQGNLPWISSSDINEDSIHKIEISRFITAEALSKSATKIVPTNSILIVSRVGVGKIAVTSNEISTSQDFTNFTPKTDNPYFLGYYLKSKSQLLLSFSQGMAIKGFTKDDIFNLKLFFPSNPAEQQKIAACLSSLDEVITAETEKLDLLQDHKKGLLQQLFPVEGETQPKFRFPEFNEDGDWEETTLDEVANYENGKAHEQEISDTGKYRVVNSKFISTEGEVVKFTDSANLMANQGDILMVLSDIPNGKAIAKCFYVDEDDTYTVNQRICKITPTDIDNKFLFYIQNRNKYFLAFDDGVKQTNLRKDTVLSFPFLKPKDPKEQKKIATCLTLVDDLIKKQADKIDSLQAHKKGLLQQLFPNINKI